MWRFFVRWGFWAGIGSIAGPLEVIVFGGSYRTVGFEFLAFGIVNALSALGSMAGWALLAVAYRFIRRRLRWPRFQATP